MIVYLRHVVTQIHGVIVYLRLVVTQIYGVIVYLGVESDWLPVCMRSVSYADASLELSHSCLRLQRERMQNYTAPVEIFNTTTDYITPRLPETPLHQEVSGNLEPFVYVSMIIIGTWLLLYLCNLAYKSHKYHQQDGVPSPERLQMI